MSYPLAPDNRFQRELLKTIRDKTKGIVSAAAIQPKTVRAFHKFKNNANSATIFLGAKHHVLAGESLVGDTRLFVGNLAAIGVAVVPIVAGDLKPGNMRLYSFPHAKVFDDGASGGGGASSATGGGTSASATTSSELLCIRSWFNSHVTMKVNQVDLIENLPVSRFSILEQYTDYVVDGLKHIDLLTTLILNGGKENQFIFNLGDADTSKIAGDNTTHALFGVVDLQGFELVTSNIMVRDKVAQALAA